MCLASSGSEWRPGRRLDFEIMIVNRKRIKCQVTGRFSLFVEDGAHQKIIEPCRPFPLGLIKRVVAHFCFCCRFALLATYWFSTWPSLIWLWLRPFPSQPSMLWANIGLGVLRRIGFVKFRVQLRRRWSSWSPSSLSSLLRIAIAALSLEIMCRWRGMEHFTCYQLPS